MKLALALHPERNFTRAAGVVFEEWGDVEAARSVVSQLALDGTPTPEQRVAHQVQCVLQLLRAHALEPTLIVLDGFVHTDAQETPALGRHLHDALAGRAVVIGISKTAAQLPAQSEVMREEEAAPVHVSCVGIDLGAAKARVRTLHGKRRMPTLLKLAARLAKGTAQPG